MDFKRGVLLLTVAVALAAIVGCGTSTEAPAAAGDDATTDTADVGAGAALEGFDAIPADGAGEAEAVVALGTVLPDARAMIEAAGSAWPEIDGVEPRLVAHLVRVDLADQVALFEVRADGIAHNLYAYQKAFDSGSIIWTPAEMAQSPSAAPRSPHETSAVAAVQAAMADAFPDEEFTVAVKGYRFVYIAGDAVLLTVEIGVDGAVISTTVGS